ncbi:hypothetical protein J6590_040832 [Homalodisca vitripennis]|nr:hypothetical protein J6590_040832 [Homalodisca vitripennis]
MVTVVEALQPLKLNMNNLPVVDMATLGSSEPDVFVGGDLAGLSDITVEMPTPTPTQDLLGYSALEGSIDHTPVSCTADYNININKNCRYNMDKNATNLRKWNEVKKRKGN